MSEEKNNKVVPVGAEKAYNKIPHLDITQNLSELRIAGSFLTW